MEKPAQIKDKHFRLNQTTLTRAQKALGSKTETETIEHALEVVISEQDRNQAAYAAHERFVRRALREQVEIRDVYGLLDGIPRR